MNVFYDNEVDCLYLKLGSAEPDGVIELADGINLDTTADGKLVGIEILTASLKIDLNTLLSYTLELDKSLLERKAA